jgi:hypothetical protein
MYVCLYPLLLFVAIVVGYVSGKVYRRTLGTPATPQPGTTR